MGHRDNRLQTCFVCGTVLQRVALLADEGITLVGCRRCQEIWIQGDPFIRFPFGTKHALSVNCETLRDRARIVAALRN
jgi:hypothetical protein